MSKKQVSALVIADSISEAGSRLVTMELTFPRYLLAELNTHRAFSRNSASSRARSVQKTIAEVEEDPYIPVQFYSEVKGMSGGSPLGEQAQEDARALWIQAAEYAVKHARWLSQHGVHKSQVNRVLEPFMWHTAVVTATEWENFFSQRLARLDDGRPAADPVFFELARRMKGAMSTSSPIKLSAGEWHAPYTTPEDYVDLLLDRPDQDPLELCKQLSVARCAGVSYLNQDAQREFDKDLDLYQRLRHADPPHWSPFEHVATPASASHQFYNLRGWRSLRWAYEAENG